MGLVSFIERLGSGMIGLFFKIILMLLAILLLVALVQGVITHWPFLIGILIGLPLSILFYGAIENILEAELPEIFHLRFDEIADVVFSARAQKREMQEDFNKKHNAAVSKVQEMQEELKELRGLIEVQKEKSKLTENPPLISKTHVSSRVKRGQRATFEKRGYGKHLKHLDQRDLGVDWDEYL